MLFNITINWYLSADLKKVLKGLKIDFENPAETRLFYGTIWNNIFIFIWMSPF